MYQSRMCDKASWCSRVRPMNCGHSRRIWPLLHSGHATPGVRAGRRFGLTCTGCWIFVRTEFFLFGFFLLTVTAPSCFEVEAPSSHRDLSSIGKTNFFVFGSPVRSSIRNSTRKSNDGSWFVARCIQHFFVFASSVDTTCKINGRTIF